MGQVVADTDDNKLGSWLVEYQLRKITNARVRQPADMIVH